MSLSKVYSTQDTFEPEDIIRAKLHEPPVFGNILMEKLPAEEQRKPDFRQPPPAPDLSKKDAFSHKDKDTPEASSTKPPEQKATAPHREVAEPVAAPVKREPAPPPPPPGVPLEEVQRMTAEAFQKGLKEGLQQAEEDYGAATKALLRICQQLDTVRETILKNSVSEIQDLVLAIAEKIIRHSVKEQSSTILDTVEEAIHKAVKSDEFYIYVNPDDYEIVAARSEDLIAGLNGLNNLVVKKDKTLDRGGCRIESDNCTVDATLISQLEIIRSELNEQH